MSRILKDARRWLPGLLVSLLAVVLLVRTVDWPSLKAAFTSMDWRYFVAFGVLYFGATCSRAMVSRSLLGNKPTFSQAFVAMMEGYLLNNLLPLRLGELGRAFLLGRKTGLGTMHVLSTIVIERAYDLAMAAILLLGTLPLALGMDWLKPIAFVTLGLVTLGLLSLYLMARYRIPLHGIADKLAGRWQFVAKYILPRIDSLLDGLSALTSLKSFTLSLFWILMVWTFGIANYYVLLLGIEKGIPPWWGLFVIGVASLGVAIPSAPASLGVFEAAIVGALALLGMSTGPALAYAVVLHLYHVIVSGIIGLYGLSREGETLAGIYEKLLPTKT